MVISKEQAYIEIEKHLKEEHMRSHSLAVAAVMEGLAMQFGEDKDYWFLTGLLHDLDYEYTKDNPEEHGKQSLELLAEYDVPEDILHAIHAHSENIPLETKLDKCLFASDAITGLITASALMRPEKKITTLPLKSLKKKFKSKNFAAGANREQIKSCESFGLELNDFMQLAIDSMGRYETELGF